MGTVEVYLSLETGDLYIDFITPGSWEYKAFYGDLVEQSKGKWSEASKQFDSKDLLFTWEE